MSLGGMNYFQVLDTLNLKFRDFDGTVHDVWHTRSAAEIAAEGDRPLFSERKNHVES